MLPKETFTQGQKSSNLPIEGDSADVDTQSIESLVQQTIDGKKVICLVYLPTTNIIFWEVSLMSVDVITET